MKTHPYEACNDLDSSSSYSRVLDLRGRDSSVLKDVVGVKPDLGRRAKRIVILACTGGIS